MSEIIGQTGAVSILTALIKKEREGKEDLPNGLIFSGIHGVGKTLLARMFAKGINCKGMGTEIPCNNCENCNRIDSGCSDVWEIDAATYSGVENMREVTQDLHYLPVFLKTKFVIVDEVHMLSRSAFDALLKCLQEPPNYIKFLFATTRLDKIPDTFVSRLMVLSLSKLNSKELFPYLKNLCVKEEKSIRDDVLDSISHVANGSVRQALSLLEIAFHMEGSDPETVLKYLKILSPKVCKDILMLILNGKTKEAVSFWTDLQSQGYDEKAFFHRFSELVYRLCEAKLNETDNEYKQLLDQYNLSYQLLINFWEIIIAQMEALYNGCFFTVETTLILLSLIEDKTDLISEAKRVFPSLKVL